MHRTIVGAAGESVRQVLVEVGATAAGALIFAGHFEVRTLLPGLVQLVAVLISVGAGSAALPAPIWHVFVVSNAVLGALSAA